MDLSNREAEIALLLLRNPQGLSLVELTTSINVSKRTIYRELSSLETALAHLAIQLVKENNRYHLIATSDSIAQFKRMLISQSTTSFSSVSTRQSALAVQILMSNETMPTKDLATGFAVSNATISQDLNTIEPVFNDYDVQIQRIKAKGIQVQGKESNIRRVISGILSSEINEYEFFQYLSGIQDQDNEVTQDSDSQYFIGLMDPKLLQQAQKVIESRVKSNFATFSDSQLKQLIIILTVSATRIRQHQLIHRLKHVDQNALFKYQPLAIDLFNEFDHDVRDHITMVEIEFLAQQIQGMSFSIMNNILQDDYDLRLSYQIRNLIKVVSKGFGYDFRPDNVLFEDLLAHVAATFKRNPSQLPEWNNNVLQNVVEKYPKLYEQVRHGLEVVFTDEKLPPNEAAYILIHFASALEQQRRAKPITALVICANGVGTARVLEHRLMKTVPEISNYRVSRVAELNTLDIAKYDIVLSTIFLPGFKYPYRVISPLLLNNEVKEIKNYISEQFGIKDVAPHTNQVTAHINNPIEVFNDMFATVQLAKSILDAVQVTKVNNDNLDLKKTLIHLTLMLPDYVADAQAVTDALYERMQRAPVGIPNTGMALVHTTNLAVLRPLFTIYDLSKPLSTQGMDYQDMAFNRVLFMIAPAKMSKLQADLLGSISGSIVDNDLNLGTYQKGDSLAVKQLISKLFLEQIQHKEGK